jgi:AcrR family transcriptional regulator
MTTTPTKGERTRARIIDAARTQFLERGIESVSVRDVAAAAGVTHALVHRYFGSREQLVASVIRREIENAAVALADRAGTMDPFDALREMVRYALTDGRGFIRFVNLAESSGLKPETLVPADPVRPFELLARRLAEIRARDDAPEGAPDPAITMLVVSAAAAGFATNGPWLLAGVGLDPAQAEARRDEFIEELMRMATSALGAVRQA